MKILISNDDGIYAPGILQLAKSMTNLGDVVVVAPNMERSASGHAITMHHPLRVREEKLPGLEVKAFSVDGTPADCVKMGIDILLEEQPDIVFTGINQGANLGTDVIYSGTVSAAVEATIMGVPSAAFSFTTYKTQDFKFAGEIALEVAEKIIANPLPAGSLLNVNIPYTSREECKGFKVTRLGRRKYSKNYVKRKDPRGKVYYWLAGDLMDDHTVENSDIEAIKNNYVSLTPLHLDLTDHSLIDKVNAWWS